MWVMTPVRNLGPQLLAIIRSGDIAETKQHGPLFGLV